MHFLIHMERKLKRDRHSRRETGMCCYVAGVLPKVPETDKAAYCLSRGVEQFRDTLRENTQVLTVLFEKTFCY